MTAAKRGPAPPISDEEEARIQAGIAADPDNPELTDEQLAAMRPASEVLPPDLYAALLARTAGRRGPGKRPAKVAVTIRVEAGALEAWKASGPGWQARVNELMVREAPKAKRRA